MRKKIILIMGLAGSGKTTLAKKLYFKLKKKTEWINADKVRSSHNDWDFSKEGILRQSKRIKNLALKSKKDIIITDFICPYKKGRLILKPNLIIWIDTIQKSRFRKRKIERIFEKPTNYDIRVSTKNSAFWNKIVLDKINGFKWNNKNSTAIMLGRYQPFHLGHERLFIKCLEKVDQVLICVKDVYKIGDNPYKFNLVKKTINSRLYKNFKNRFKIIKVPNITNIFYGRKVGYKIKQIHLEKKIQSISGTKIRKNLRSKGLL
jgi:adenylylsulfate kinase